MVLPARSVAPLMDAVYVVAGASGLWRVRTTLLASSASSGGACQERVAGTMFPAESRRVKTTLLASTAWLKLAVTPAMLGETAAPPGAGNVVVTKGSWTLLKTTSTQ